MVTEASASNIYIQVVTFYANIHTKQVMEGSIVAAKQCLFILFAIFLPQTCPRQGKEISQLYKHALQKFLYRILRKPNCKKKICHFERGLHFSLLWFFFCMSKMRTVMSKGILLVEISGFCFPNAQSLLAAVLVMILSQQLTKCPLTAILTSEHSFG